MKNKAIRLTRLAGISLSSATMVLGVVITPAASVAAEAHSFDVLPQSTSLVTANGKIAFANKGQIWTVNVDGTEVTQLTKGSNKKYSPSYSPDGMQIVYANEKNDTNRDLWIMNADGSNKMQVTASGHISKGGATWSPDGKKLAFGGPCIEYDFQSETTCDYFEEVDIFGESHYALDTMSAVPPFKNLKTLKTCIGESCEQSDLAPMGAIGQVAWSPLGNNIVFYTETYPSYNDNWLINLSLDTHKMIEIDGINGSEGGYGFFGNPAFSPHGDLLAFDSYIDSFGYIEHEGIQLCNYPAIDECDMFKQVLNDIQLEFAPMQNKTVFSNSTDGNKLYTADMDGKHRTYLTEGVSPSWQAIK